MINIEIAHKGSCLFSAEALNSLHPKEVRPIGNENGLGPYIVGFLQEGGGAGSRVCAGTVSCRPAHEAWQVLVALNSDGMPL